MIFILLNFLLIFILSIFFFFFFFLHFKIDCIQRYQENSSNIFNFAAHTSPLFFSIVLPKGNSPVTSVCVAHACRGEDIYSLIQRKLN
jgi:hypothetical protein